MKLVAAVVLALVMECGALETHQGMPRSQVHDLLHLSLGPAEITDAEGWAQSEKSQKQLLAHRDEVLDPLIAISMDATVAPKERLLAIRLLGKFQLESAVGTLEYLASSSETSVRHIALQSLGLNGTPRALEVLLSKIHDMELSSDPLLHVAFRALSEVSNPNAVPFLEGLLACSNQTAVACVQAALCRTATEDAIEALCTSLTDPRAGVRRAAAELLSTTPSAHAINQLRASLTTEDQDGVKVEIARSLVQLGVHDATDALLEEFALQGDPAVRQKAISALPMLQGRRGWALLRQLATAADADTRLSAIDAAIASHSDEATEILEKATVSETVGFIRARAQEGLRARGIPGESGSDLDGVLPR